MILVIAATNTEIRPLVNSKITEGVVETLSCIHDADILVAGVGVAATTFHLTKALSKKKYSHVINLGVAGTFNPEFSVGDVVRVEADTFADYGVDDSGVFKTLFQLGLSDPNMNPFTNGWMKCNFSNPFLAGIITSVKGVTVSMASGSQERIDLIKTKFNPDIETMESAGVFFTCLMFRVPFISLRGISNMVEPRNRERWNIQLAAENSCSVTKSVLNNLSI